MKYSLTTLQNDYKNKKPIKFLFFWGHKAYQVGQIDKACLSQWWPCKFYVEEQQYLSAEQYMMAEKARLFGDSLMLERILGAKSPSEAKRLGRAVQGFTQAIWEQNRCEIVKKGNWLKFGQNLPLKEYLLTTKNRVLVEASPIDTIWGIGMAKEDKAVNNPLHWRGLNLLGFALMEVRDMLS